VIALVMAAVPASAGDSGSGHPAGESYHLVFLQPPGGAQVDANITAQTFNPAGTRVKVAVEYEDGSIVTSCTAAITLSILDNPGGGTLGGVTTVHAVHGVATFTALSIDRHGLGYTLQATSPSITPATSDPFDIVDVGKICGPGPCSGHDATESTRVLLRTPSGHAGDLLSLSLGVQIVDCPGYEESSDAATFDVSGSDRMMKVTLMTFDDSLGTVGHDDDDEDLQVCYASSVEFIQRNGTPAPLIHGFYTGLLPDCDRHHQAAPCVLSRYDGEDDNASVTFLAPAGDPSGRT
jgi:hypothetical protein